MQQNNVRFLPRTATHHKHTFYSTLHAHVLGRLVPRPVRKIVFDFLKEPGYDANVLGSE